MKMLSVFNEAFGNDELSNVDEKLRDNSFRKGGVCLIVCQKVGKVSNQLYMDFKPKKNNETIRIYVQ